MRKNSITAFFVIIFSLFCSDFFAQNSKPQLEFYGTVSSSQDKEILKLTQDLFYSQLADSDLFTVVDKRHELYEEGLNTNNAFVFFLEIQEVPEGWLCVLNLRYPKENKNFNFSKIYDSYYRILTEAKNTLALLLNNVQSPPEQTEHPSSPAAPTKITSVEMLAGTWKGGQYIDKIMILKGNRGFVIFKNGATMNITLTLNGSTVTAVQNSKPNASFFPELPREEALQIAQNSEPIEWRFTVNQDGTELLGEKKALSTTTPAVWKKQ